MVEGPFKCAAAAPACLLFLERNGQDVMSAYYVAGISTAPRGMRSLIYRRILGDTERLSSLPKASQLVRVRAGMLTPTQSFPMGLCTSSSGILPPSSPWAPSSPPSSPPLPTFLVLEVQDAPQAPPPLCTHPLSLSSLSVLRFLFPPRLLSDPKMPLLPPPKKSGPGRPQSIPGPGG